MRVGWGRGSLRRGSEGLGIWLGPFPVFGLPPSCRRFLLASPGPSSCPKDQASPPGAASHLWREDLSSPGSGSGRGASGLRLKHLLEETLSSLPDPHLPCPHSQPESGVTHPTPMQLGHPGALVWQ